MDGRGPKQPYLGDLQTLVLNHLRPSWDDPLDSNSQQMDGFPLEKSGESQGCSGKQCYGFCRLSHKLLNLGINKNSNFQLDCILYDISSAFPCKQPHLPSWELTYPIPAGTFEDDFPFPQLGVPWDMLVPWRVHLTSNPETLKLQNLPAKWKAKFDSPHLVAVVHVVILKVVLTFCPQQSTFWMLFWRLKKSIMKSKSTTLPETNRHSSWTLAKTPLKGN